jgi:hypothetical protein
MEEDLVSAIESMKAAHASLVEGLQGDTALLQERADRQREDINRELIKRRTMERQLRVIEKKNDDLHEVIRRQERTIVSLERRVWDVEEPPASSPSSGLSYNTPPQASGSVLVPASTDRAESPAPLPIRDPSVPNDSNQENIPVLDVPAVGAEREVIGVRRTVLRLRGRAEPYSMARMALGDRRQRALRDARVRRLAADSGRETSESGDDDAQERVEERRSCLLSSRRPAGLLESAPIRCRGACASSSRRSLD